MEILNKPINSFSFDDVVSFCKLGLAEGIQLDYKKALPKDGLSKHFAAFSNTRGGVVIIGVEEAANGTPGTHDGISFDSKLIDTINQYAANVDPLPTYDIHHTNAQNGKVFILVRVFEGSNTPYYVQNDPRLYVRTGNITKLIDLASPDYVELLIGKREKAELSRAYYVNRAHDIFQAALRRAEKQRKREIEEEKENNRKDPTRESNVFFSQIHQHELGAQSANCTVLIQPFYPSEPLGIPTEIKANLEDIRIQTKFYDYFPSLNPEAVQDGLLTFEWNRQSGEIDCEQLYSTGLVYKVSDVLRIDNIGKRIVYIAGIASTIFLVLQASKRFYRKYHYQGTLVGHILIQNVHDVEYREIVPQGYHTSPSRHTKISLLPKYLWSLELDTTTLNNNENFKQYFTTKLREIYWSLGFENLPDQLILDFLEKDLGWKVS